MDDDIVTCEICMEAYDNVLRIPKQLPCCNNNFCLNCLNDLFKRNNNNIICPICRTSNPMQPSSLPTDNSVFANFLTCLTCKKQIIKSEINISLDSHSLTCAHCASNDMVLTEFFGYIIDDLNEFIKDNSQEEETNIIKFIYSEVTNKINSILTPILNEFRNDLVTKIITDIEKKYQYNIKTSKTSYNSYFTGIKKVCDNINSFIKDVDAKVDLKQLQDDIQYYTKNFDGIKTERNKIETVNNLFKEGELVKLKANVKDVKVFLMNAFETKSESELNEKNVTTPGLEVFKEKIHTLENKNSNLERINNDLERANYNLKMEIKKLYNTNKKEEEIRNKPYEVMNNDGTKLNNFGFYSQNKIRIVDIYEQ